MNSHSDFIRFGLPACKISDLETLQTLLTTEHTRLFSLELLTEEASISIIHIYSRLSAVKAELIIRKKDLNSLTNEELLQKDDGGDAYEREAIDLVLLRRGIV